MKDTIQFRAFQESDRRDLENVVRQTWNYDRFCSPKTAARLARVYLSSCLAEQTFTQVALMDETPVGIIMACDKRLRKISLHQLRLLGQLAVLYSTREGRVTSQVFQEVNRLDQSLLQQCTIDYQGELVFFALSPRCRGKGIGRDLFERAVAYMKARDIPAFYLFTDTTCNYGFYEHQGMQRRQTKQCTFRINGKPETMTFFLYDYAIGAQHTFDHSQ